MDSKQAPTNKQHLSVPTGWKLVPIEPTVPMVVLAAESLCCEFDPHTVGPQAKFMLAVYREFLAAAPEPEQQVELVATATNHQTAHGEKSRTHGMTLGERIAHVGGRTNKDGYIEFGSVVAVDALIRHVLRDLSAPPAAPQFEAPKAAELLTDAAETIDLLTSKVPTDSPLQTEARAGAKALVEKLYAMAEALS